MKFRNATPDDSKSIAHVQVSTWRSTYKEIVPGSFLENLSIKERENRWTKMVEDPGYLIYVAEDKKDGIVGFISGGKEREDHPFYTGEVYAIYILAAYQRQGIGKALLLPLLQKLRAHGHSSLLIWALRDNPSRPFYEAIGGIPVAEQTLTLAGEDLIEIAYGWKDLSKLLFHLQQKEKK